MPDSSPTIARREPTIRLNSVDLPTFGRPTMARRGRETVMDEQYPRRDSHPRLSAVMQAVRPAGQQRAGVPTCAVEYYRASVASTSQPSASAQKKDVSLYQFFSPGGVLSRTHPAYEFRRGQLQMAQAVEQVLGEKRHLIVEAGTGTGKTLAYLMPVIRSGKRVIISTGTKNLQEQLFYKDIPFLEQALFPNGEGKLSVCYMKGRNNYLCRKKLYDLTDTPVLSGLDEIEHYRAIAAGILPDAGTVIFDEAHELEDVASSYFGIAVSNARVEELCRDVEASLQRNHLLSASVSGALKSLRERAMFFFALLPQGDGRFAFENRREFLEENGEEFLPMRPSECCSARNSSNSWKKMARSFWRCSIRSDALAQSWKICRPNRRRSSTLFVALGSCRCSSGSSWNPMTGTPSSGSSEDAVAETNRMCFFRPRRST